MFSGWDLNGYCWISTLCLQQRLITPLKSQTHFSTDSLHYEGSRKCSLSKSTVYFTGSSVNFIVKVNPAHFSPQCVFLLQRSQVSLSPFELIGHWKLLFHSAAISLLSQFLRLKRVFTSIICFQHTKQLGEGFADTPVLEVRKVVTFL